MKAKIRKFVDFNKKIKKMFKTFRDTKENSISYNQHFKIFHFETDSIKCLDMVNKNNKTKLGENICLINSLLYVYPIYAVILKSVLQAPKRHNNSIFVGLER